MNLGHGGNIEEISRLYGINKNDLIDFSANINPLGLAPKVKLVMESEISEVERYPDITYYNLKKAIAKYENINMDSLFVGNGAAEVIFNIVRAVKPKNVLLPAPTFSEYEDAVKSIGGNLEYFYLQNDFELDREFLNYLTEEIDMVFVCNPNNPTGVISSRDYIVEILEKAKANNIIVVIDESFLDFVKEKDNITAIQLIRDYRNLIIVKSLTKFYAFPGIRLGYGISGNKALQELIDRVAIPWSINTIASRAGEVAVNESGYREETIEYVNRNKELLYNGLREIQGIRVFKPSVNFIFFKVNTDIDLKKELLKVGIIIRSCDNYIGLDKSYYRIAVRKEEENIRLLEELGRIL